ncbi:hypothetical protein [Alterisphingorhabdus coralli]|uniref:Uncharacterized protein n=1 Tax=Alterisphingorhabdus coralli TaxID=3071408 RepID=A0AA97I2I2_9SPHN|nr:hypothetical protein [Parasphingorhabdus sp. SCSIO 66989]WOE76278.1 hypothetical protein RB602_06070 [Parasphingorhabdus sp. SCSIO 66989]
MSRQVEIFGDLVLVVIYGDAPDPKGKGSKFPSRYIRCCRLRKINGENGDGDKSCVEAELRSAKNDYKWKSLEDAMSGERDSLWWSLLPLQEKFSQLSEQKEKNGISQAIEAISGLLNN